MPLYKKDTFVTTNLDNRQYFPLQLVNKSIKCDFSENFKNFSFTACRYRCTINCNSRGLIINNFCTVNYFSSVMKAVGLVEVWTHVFQTWALNVCERLVSLFDRFCHRASPGAKGRVGSRAGRRIEDKEDGIVCRFRQWKTACSFFQSLTQSV